jgi:hypothetical protein
VLTPFQSLRERWPRAVATRATLRRALNSGRYARQDTAAAHKITAAQPVPTVEAATVASRLLASATVKCF